MVLRKEIAQQIKDLLKKNPQGMSISEIVRAININRNTAGRYLENLLVSGQVEMRKFGMAKIYTPSQRVPLSAVLSISSELVMQLDNNLRIVFTNEPFLDIIGTDEKEILGKNVEYTPVTKVFDDSFPLLLRKIQDGLNGNEGAGDIILHSKDLIFFYRIAPTVFEDGRKGVSVILEDITKQRRADNALRESEDRYRKLVEISPDAVFLHREGKILYANPATLRLLGSSHPGEIIGKNILDFIHPAFQDVIRINIQKDLEGEISPRTELHMVRVDGTSILVEGRGIGTLIDGKSALQVAIRDITEQRQAETALRESEEKYRALAEASNDLIFVIGMDDRVEYVNSYASVLVNKSVNQIIGEPRALIFPPDVARNQKKALQTVFETGHPVRSEGPLTFNGLIRWFDHYLTPLKDVDNHIQSVLGISRDITERKNAENQLQSSEERLRLLLDSSEDLIIMQDPEGRYLYFNASARYGVSEEMIIGSTPFDILDKGSADRIVKRVRYVVKTGENIREESPIVWKNQTLWFSDSLSPVKDANGTIIAVVTISHNITERKHSEMALLEREQLYQRLLEQSFDAIDQFLR